MIMIIRPAKLIWIVSFIFATAIAGICQQPSNLLDRKISSLKMSNSNERLILFRLSTEYNVPTGLEVILDENNQTSDQKISINIENGTVRDVLDTIVKADPRYTWAEINNVINLYPKKGRDGITDTFITYFHVAEMNKKEASKAITELPEVKVRLQNLKLTRVDMSLLIGSSQQEFPHFSLTLYNLTVREILNEMIRRGYTNYWVVERYGNNYEYITIMV